MDSHTQKLLSIRPSLSAEPADDSEMANFQVNTLRPILKMQHDLIIEIFKSYLKEVRQDFSQHSERQQRDFIEQALVKQASLKFTLLGVIVGHFTSEEYGFYQKNQKDILKRLVRFLSKRIFDGLR